MKTAETQQARLLRRQRQVEFLQPFRQHPVERFRILLVAKRAHPIVSIAAEQRLAISPVSISTQYSWNTRFALSTPTTVCFISDPPVCL